MIQLVVRIPHDCDIYWSEVLDFAKNKKAGFAETRLRLVKQSAGESLYSFTIYHDGLHHDSLHTMYMIITS